MKDAKKAKFDALDSGKVGRPETQEAQKIWDWGLFGCAHARLGVDARQQAMDWLRAAPLDIPEENVRGWIAEKKKAQGEVRLAPS